VGSGVTLILENNITLQGRSELPLRLVWVNSGGKLEMKAGSKISGNTSSDNGGGGVGVYSRGTFTMSGGEISGNTTNSPIGGGGVFVDTDATFTMSGGTISGNTAYKGSGVYVNAYSTFTMSGGTISGNTASNGSGGGVYVKYDATFTKETGGIIYGQDEGNAALRNTAKDFSSGHAVYYLRTSFKRNSTARNGVTLDTRVSGAAGGWVDTVPANLSFEDALKWFNGNLVTNTAYTLTLNRDETIAPSTFSNAGSPLSITIRGDTEERTISLSESGSLFTVGSGVTLILENNITLQGRSDNTASLVRVNNGTLEMRSGSKISDNTSSYGGGVYVNGAFTMNGGEISGNTASSGNGGGVYFAYGRFTMSGGTISGNTASSGNGGGVYVNGTFTMSGGEISDNTASSGGGVFVSSDGTFTKQTGGVIYGSNGGNLKNTATNGDGHAVYVDSSPAKKRNTTAGQSITLESAKNGSYDGWE
jgi:hypothetical protein